MSKKPSLGHNPLDQNLRNHGSFDFIKDTAPKKEKSKKAKGKTVSKKVVSYYLEEDVIDKIKTIAKTEEKSFSALANELLNASIDKKETD